jgi:hypothetical protein
MWSKGETQSPQVKTRTLHKTKDAAPAKAKTPASRPKGCATRLRPS